MYKNRSGFTLIELLIVIALIAIFATISLAFLLDARQQSRDQARITDTKQLRLALRLYKEAEGIYPDYPDPVEIGVGNAIDADIARFVGGEVRSDPFADQAEYGYVYDSDFDCNGRLRPVIQVLQFETDKFTQAAAEDASCGGVD